MPMIPVLYVDDEPLLLEIGRLFLEKDSRFSVDTACSATEALKKMEHRTYSAIVSDYQMPGTNGIAFLKKIRGVGDPVPFIIFTGRGREEIVIQALNEGADFYLQKGGDPEAQFTELKHQICQAVQQRRAERHIRDLERRESDIINFLPDATFAIDTHGVVIAWNRVMEAMTGIPAAKILGKGNYEYALPFYHQRRPLLIDLVLCENPAIEKNYPFIVREGSKLIAEAAIPHFNNGNGASLWFIASPLCDTNGAVVGAIESIRDITERTRAKAAIIESEERYRNVVEDQTEFICRFTPDGTHIFVNAAYCRYFGYTRGQILGHRFRPEIPAEDRSRLHRFFTSFCPDHPVGMIDHRIRMPDGSIRWQRWSDRAVFDKDGRIIEFQSVGRDITEYKSTEEQLLLANRELSAAYEQLAATEEELRQNYEELGKSQQELRQSEERYRNIVEDQTEFICRFTPDGTHVFVNVAYCRYFNKRYDEIAGKRFVPEIPAEERNAVRAHFASLTPHHPVAEIRHRIIMPDGRIRWQRWSDRAIFDARGTLIEYQSVGRDISEIVTAERALRESEEKYLRFFRTSGDCVFITTTDGNWIDFNDAAVELFGFASREELMQEKIPRLYITPEERIRHMRIMTERGFTKEYPVGLRRKDGAALSTLVTSMTLYDADGNITGFQGTIRDITGQKVQE